MNLNKILRVGQAGATVMALAGLLLWRLIKGSAYLFAKMIITPMALAAVFLIIFFLRKGLAIRQSFRA